jgi:hypothetical protein
LSSPHGINCEVFRTGQLTPVAFVLAEIPGDWDQSAIDDFLRFFQTEALIADATAATARLGAYIACSLPGATPAEVQSLADWVDLYEPE